MKKLWPVALLALIIIVLAVFYPKIQSTFQPAPPSSPYEEFGSFIPYTFGAFPEGFSIQQAGTNFTHQSGLDQFEEWYLSDQYFVLLIQSHGSQAIAYHIEETISLSRLVLGQKASMTPLKNEELNNWIDAKFSIESIDVQEVWLLSFSLDNRLIQLISNLPAEDLSYVAENLVRSICLNPTPTSEE